jgi:hypothetical protein
LRRPPARNTSAQHASFSDADTAVRLTLHTTLAGDDAFFAPAAIQHIRVHGSTVEGECAAKLLLLTAPNRQETDDG